LLDAALYAEYSRGLPNGTPDAIKFGPLLRKEIGPTINIVNLFLAREIGPYSSTDQMSFRYAWETRIATEWIVEPGFQAYGEPRAFRPFLRRSVSRTIALARKSSGSSTSSGLAL
jgi:hypothetical protein